MKCCAQARRAACRKGWKLFVPHVQSYEPIVGAHMDAVRQNKVIAACDDLDAKQAIGMVRVFDHPVVQAQMAVEHVQYRA